MAAILSQSQYDIFVMFVRLHNVSDLFNDHITISSLCYLVVGMFRSWYLKIPQIQFPTCAIDNGPSSGTVNFLL